MKHIKFVKDVATTKNIAHVSGVCNKVSKTARGTLSKTSDYEQGETPLCRKDTQSPAKSQKIKF